MKHITANFEQAFKEADIRGVYPSEIDDEVAYLVARAFVEEFNYMKVVVARDMRVSSPQLRAAFIKGANDAGASVVDLGLTTTPMLYFASATMKLPGVMITASHSPKNQNGFKLVHVGAVPLTNSSGLRALKARLAKGRFADPARRPGKLTEKSIMAEFSSFILKGQSKSKGGRSLKIVVDAGNGMGALLIPLVEKLGVDVTPLFAELDGRFPHRGSNPTVPRNQTAIVRELKKGGYDFGIAFDGDADRIAFFDEQGRYVNCAAVGALIAADFLKKHPNATFVQTVLTSRAYAEAVRAGGGKLVWARVGHSYIKEVMRKKDALFGCEHSGHFFFKDFFYTDSVMLTLRQVVTNYRAQSVSFSETVTQYTHYFQTDDVMVEVRDEKAALTVMEKFAAALGPHALIKRDGITVDCGDAWVVVKPSVTETALNIIAEGKTLKAARALRDQFVAQARTLA